MNPDGVFVVLCLPEIVQLFAHRAENASGAGRQFLEDNKDELWSKGRKYACLVDYYIGHYEIMTVSGLSAYR